MQFPLPKSIFDLPPKVTTFRFARSPPYNIYETPYPNAITIRSTNPTNPSGLQSRLLNLNRKEEEGLKKTILQEIEQNKLTKEEAIYKLNQWMSLWKTPNGQYSRVFQVIPDFIQELELCIGAST